MCGIIINFALSFKAPNQSILQNIMKTIKDTEFGGERPLFGTHDLRLENVTIHAGESAIKECSNIEADHCRFEGNTRSGTSTVSRSTTAYSHRAPAALWYSRNLLMTDTQVDAPKMFREMQHLKLVNVRIPDAQETLWDCADVVLEDVEVANADYIFMRSHDIKIKDYKQKGNYSFQYCRNVEIRNAHLNTKDAFWGTEDVTVYDSVIEGEYLGWHSKRLRLVRCHIAGTQPLCYATDLVMEDCTMGEDADLAFEYSTVKADIKGNIPSVKNPRGGRITADSIGEIILDEHIKAPGDCVIERREEKN